MHKNLNISTENYDFTIYRRLKFNSQAQASECTRMMYDARIVPVQPKMPSYIVLQLKRVMMHSIMMLDKMSNKRRFDLYNEAKLH